MTELLVNYKHKNIISQKSKIHRNIISIPRHTIISAVWAYIAHIGSILHTTINATALSKAYRLVIESILEEGRHRYSAILEIQMGKL